MVRADEWQKSTPMAFSQEYNKTGKYPYYSDTLRGCKTDVFIVYGQPVMNPLIIFIPFHLGYLLFGSSRGLAFYWITRLVSLMLISIDFFMILSNKNKSLALAGAILITFAPVVQWWFAINGFVEIIIYGELAIIILYQYLNNERKIIKLICTLGLVICAGGYVLSFYPAWQVPFVFVYLVLAIWVICTNYKHAKLSLHVDGSMILLFVVLMGTFFCYLFMLSHDTIKAIMNTAYPGKRSIYGGGGIMGLFQWPGNIFLPLINQNISVFYNESEAAKFFDFCPFGIILSVLLWVKTKRKDVFNILLLCVNIVLVLYVCFAWPEWLARITLLSFSSTERTVIAIGYVNILLLIKNLASLNFSLKKSSIIAISAIATMFIVLGVYYSSGSYLQSIMFLVVTIVIALGSYLIMTQNYKGLLAYSITIVFGQGILVNPIQKGIDVIYDNPLTQAIYDVANSNDGVWITDNISTPLFNLPIIVGAPTINSINIYPNLDLWHKIDDKKEYEDIYNRQAHIGISIIEEEIRSNTI